MEASWAKSTRSSYNSYLKRWRDYCGTRSISTTDASIQDGADFLSFLFKSGEKYGYIAGSRSALSAILPRTEGKTFGEQEVVKRVLKGVFKQRPSFPRNIVIYDANIVELNHSGTFEKVNFLNFLQPW